MIVFGQWGCFWIHQIWIKVDLPLGLEGDSHKHDCVNYFNSWMDTTLTHFNTTMDVHVGYLNINATCNHHTHKGENMLESVCSDGVLHFEFSIFPSWRPNFLFCKKCQNCVKYIKVICKINKTQHWNLEFGHTWLDFLKTTKKNVSIQHKVKFWW